MKKIEQQIFSDLLQGSNLNVKIKIGEPIKSSLNLKKDNIIYFNKISKPIKSVLGLKKDNIIYFNKIGEYEKDNSERLSLIKKLQREDSNYSNTINIKDYLE